MVMAQNSQGIRNVHGQSRFIDGAATIEGFVDYGEPQWGKFVRFRVYPAPDGAIQLEINGDMCASFNDAPQLRIVVNGIKVIDTGDPDDGLPQPQD